MAGVFLFSARAFADIHTAQATGNWETAGTWDLGVPATTDDVVIPSPYTVTQTAAITINSVTVNQGGQLTIANKNFTSNGTMSISGTVVNNSATGTKTVNNVTVNDGGLFDFTANESVGVNGNIVVNGTGAIDNTGRTGGVWTLQKTGGGSISGTSTTSVFHTVTLSTSYTNSLTFSTIGSINIGSGLTLTNTGNITVGTSGGGETIKGSGGNFTNGVNGYVKLVGSNAGFANTGTTTVSATGNTVEFAFAGAQTPNALNYYNLTLSASGAKTLGATTYVAGTLTTSGTVTSGNANEMATTPVGALVVGSGTTWTWGAYNFTVTGTTSVSGTLAHSSATGTKIYTGAVTINSGGSWTNAGNSAITFRGGLSHSGSTFTSGTGVYTFDTSSQAIAGSSAISIGSVTITGVTVTNNNSNASGVTISTTLTGTGGWAQGTNAALTLSGTSSGISSLTASASGNTVNYAYTSGAETLHTTTYHHLTITKSATTASLAGNTVVNGNLTITSGTLDVTTNNYSLSVAGNWTNTPGGLSGFNSRSGTVTFNGSSAQTINSANTWYDLAVTASANRTVSFQSSVAQSITNAGGSLQFYADEGFTLTLAPLTATTTWLLQLNSSITKQYVHNVSVSYSNAGPPGTYATILADDGSNTNGGSNTNWQFGATAVRIAKFYALGYAQKVVAYWQTATEYKNLGFNVYRGPTKDGPFTQLNSSLIIGAGSTITSRDYSFTDMDVTAGNTYYYLLEDVQTDGVKNRHGPVEAHPGLDADNDGMSDDWEKYYGLNPNDPADASLDSDNDGKTNLEEYLAGTNPLVSDKPLEEDNTSGGVKIISQDSAGITLELITPRFNAISQTQNNVAYTLLSIPGYTHDYIREPGAPKLPVKTALIAIPQNTKAVIRNITYNEIVGLRDCKILPAPKLLVEETTPEGAEAPIRTLKETFAINQVLYATNAYYPNAIVEVVNTGSLRDQNIAAVSFYPFAYNPVLEILKLYKRIRVNIDFAASANEDSEADALAAYQNSYSGYPRLKIFTTQEGMYKLDYNSIYNAGFYDIIWLDPRTIKLYHDGLEVPISIHGEADGWFGQDDYILFYASPFNSIYSAKDCYVLEFGGTRNGLRIEEIPASEGEAAITPAEFSYTLHDEANDEYWPEVEGPDEVTNHWFSWNYIFNDYQTDFILSPPSLASDAAYDAHLKVSLWACLQPPDIHHVKVSVNGHEVAEKTWEGKAIQTIEASFPASYLTPGENTVSFLATLEEADVVFDAMLVDYIELGYKRQFQAKNNRLIFDYVASGRCQFTIGGFSNADAAVFDVTDEQVVKRFTGFASGLENNGVTYAVSFKDEPLSNKRYLVATPEAYCTPAQEDIVLDAPSDLTSRLNQADLLIITAKEFIDALQPLVELRQAQQLAVRVIDVGDIYDEFSYGTQTPHAIKDFLKYAYRYWQRPAPTYVLLVGHASYDYKDYTQNERANFVPTYLTHTQYFGETGSDNWFVCLDPAQAINGKTYADMLPDMFIGRLPVRTVDELSGIINKIIAYEGIDIKNENKKPEWLKRFLLVVDDDPEMGKAFQEAAADSLALIPTKKYAVTQIKLADYADPAQASADLKAAINSGALMAQYVGHGAVENWSSANVLSLAQIPQLANKDKYPFMYSLTCMDGFYLHPHNYPCMAEVLLREKEKGALACWASTGMTDPNGQKYLSYGLLNAVFNDENIILGPATAQAKAYIYSVLGPEHNDWIATWTLFGDPSQSLKIKKKPKKIKETHTPITTTAPPAVIPPATTPLSTTADVPLKNIGRLAVINHLTAINWQDFNKRPEDTYRPEITPAPPSATVHTEENRPAVEPEERPVPSKENIQEQPREEMKGEEEQPTGIKIRQEQRPGRVVSSSPEIKVTPKKNTPQISVPAAQAGATSGKNALAPSLRNKKNLKADARKEAPRVTTAKSAQGQKAAPKQGKAKEITQPKPDAVTKIISDIKSFFKHLFHF